MILIAHRGNTNGPNTKLENSPEYISKALREGFHVEIDVWFKDGKWFLGHDGPDYEIEVTFLKQSGLWCHCKNLEALVELRKLHVHCFYHEDDNYTLTSKGIVWGHYKSPPPPHGIYVMKDKDLKHYPDCLGVCSDYVSVLRDNQSL
jgi:glycerophosphoryl diester phosphodiesterase